MYLASSPELGDRDNSFREWRQRTERESQQQVKKKTQAHLRPG